MSSGFRAHPDAAVSLAAQNGRAQDTTPNVKADCASKKKHRTRGGSR